MTDYKNSETLINLRRAFSGESMARNRYTFFAKTARREGQEEIAEVFELFADNEKEHARIWCSELKELAGTDANLHSALAGEIKETETLYPEFAAMAEQEGFHTTAALFRRVAEIEKRHAQRFQELLDKLEGRTPAPEVKQPLPSRGKRFMICKFCGAMEVVEPGASCPVCANEKAF